MCNYKLVITYDGGRYDGFSRKGKDESDNTIECKIKAVITKMLECSQDDIELYVACRTEKGVHATYQVINVKLAKSVKAYELMNYLNRYLPRDISVIEAEEADDRFNSQLNAKSKTYEYRLDTASVANVFDRKYAYHTFDKPDIDKMRECAKLFVGEHDFKSFTTAKKSKTTIRVIESITVDCGDEMNSMLDVDKVYITIKANDFLHNMARLMIGAMLDVGSGMRTVDSVRKQLDGDKNGSLPAESYGLFLVDVGF